MKKAIVFLSTVLLIGAIAFSANANIRTTLSKTTLVKGNNQMQLEVKGAQIVSPNNWVFNLDNVGDFNYVDWYVTSVTSGNVTTASMVPVFADGSTISQSMVSTSSVHFTDIDSMYMKMIIVNPKPGVTNNITCNILLRN